VKAEGKPKSGGVEQRVEVVVLRRPRLVTLTVVIAVNAISQGLRSGRIAERLVRTMRSRAIGPGS